MLGVSMGKPDRTDMAWLISSLLIVVLITCGVAWLVKGAMDRDKNAQAAAYASAQFHRGQVVRSRVGGFRGLVTDVACNTRECGYRVRFPTASMEPQWVYASEIEPSK